MRNKVLSCYFATKQDPQRQKLQERNDFQKMETWYKSLHRIGLEGVIFHDHLEESFQTSHSSELLDFVKVETGDRSLNDDRFYHYKEYLENHSGLDNIIFTDLFDVEFRRNPFELFQDDYQLYSGDEPRSISGNNWMMNKLEVIKRFIGDFPENFALKQTLNAGIIGGSREVLLALIEEMLELFESLPLGFNANMPVYNIVARKKFEDEEILHGLPLSSHYKSYQEEGDFYIRHK